MSALRISVKVIVVGSICAVLLAGCTGSSSNAANITACTDVNNKLASLRGSATDLIQQYEQGELLLVLPELQRLYADLSTDLSVLASSSSGDVTNELNSASDAASNVADTIVALETGANEEALAKLTGIVGEGGTLDEACQSVGSEPFSTGWSH